MMDSLRQYDRSWLSRPSGEIVATAEAHGSVLVVPVGSVEQHGHHLPVGTDTYLATAVVRAAAAEAPPELPLLVSPPVWAGFSPYHLPFGGTISLEYGVMMALLENVAATALENGFDALLFVNGHGGNGPIVDAATSVIGRGADAEILAVTYFELAAPFVDGIRESDPGGMAHGGEFETSLMLHLFPDLVREEAPADRLEEPYELGPRDMFDSGPLTVYRGFDEYSRSGAIGNPGNATAPKGAEILEELMEVLVALFEEVHEANRE
jgi:creatinine amidohydrolase